jgi:hypothetical protein
MPLESLIVEGENEGEGESEGEGEGKTEGEGEGKSEGEGKREGGIKVKTLTPTTNWLRTELAW